jgi:hypothetical protein
VRHPFSLNVHASSSFGISGFEAEHIGSALVLLWISLEFTRFFSIIVAKACRDRPIANLAIFVLALTLNYCFLAYSLPLSQRIADFILFGPLTGWTVWQWERGSVNSEKISWWQEMRSTITRILSGAYLAPAELFKRLARPFNYDSVWRPSYSLPFDLVIGVAELIPAVPGLGRILISLVFVGSYFTRPALHPIMHLFARIIESDKPVFGLVFGGVACLLEAFGWLFRQL